MNRRIIEFIGEVMRSFVVFWILFLVVLLSCCDCFCLSVVKGVFVIIYGLIVSEKF